MFKRKGKENKKENPQPGDIALMWQSLVNQLKNTSTVLKPWGHYIVKSLILCADLLIQLDPANSNLVVLNSK